MAVIVSHRHRYVFLAIPHTACTAISAELCENYDGEPVLHKHAWYDELLAAQPDVADYYVFCTVRHPLDVVVTSYFRQKTDHDGRFSGAEAGDRRVRQAQEIAALDLDFGAYIERFHAHTYVNGAITSLNGRADRVMRFERLAEDLPAAIAEIGLSFVRPLPKKNDTASRSSDFWSYVPAELRGHVMRVFGPACREWGYGFPEDWGPAPSSWRDDLEYSLAQRTIRLASNRLGIASKRASRLVAPTRVLTMGRKLA